MRSLKKFIKDKYNQENAEKILKFGGGNENNYYYSCEVSANFIKNIFTKDDGVLTEKVEFKPKTFYLIKYVLEGNLDGHSFIFYIEKNGKFYLFQSYVDFDIDKTYCLYDFMKNENKVLGKKKDSFRVKNIFERDFDNPEIIFEKVEGFKPISKFASYTIKKYKFCKIQEKWRNQWMSGHQWREEKR